MRRETSDVRRRTSGIGALNLWVRCLDEVETVGATRLSRIYRSAVETAGTLVAGLLLTPCLLSAQGHGFATPDVVVSYTPGEGGGRGSDYMPENVLGLPDTVGRTNIATTDPKQILSLGLDGEIVLRFDRATIVDGPGVDFTVFENAFVYRVGGKDRLYAEPGEVAVSRDGVAYTAFPYDPQTLDGCAGVTPTRGDQPPDQPSVSGGDGFDLSDLGVDSIRYIRIRDVTRMVKENPEHPFYDITLNGFDLDAIVGINVAAPVVSGVRDLAGIDGVRVKYSSVVRSSVFTVGITLPVAARVSIRLIDLAGNEIERVDGTVHEGGDRLIVSTDRLSSGTYIVAIEAEGIGATTGTIRVLR